MMSKSALLALLGLCLASLLLLPGSAQSDVQTGGNYRYGHIFWTSEGNTVTFTLETVFKRSNPTEQFWGAAPDGFSQVGDVITLTGREPPRFYFGDNGLVNIVQLRVTAFSDAEDWVMAETTFTHTYSAPSGAGGLPWEASFRGCCRLGGLMNNKNSDFVIAAHVDLNKAKNSPRAHILPVVTVPYHGPAFPLEKPVIQVAAEDSQHRRAIEYSIANPYDVGNAVQFSSALQSFLSIPLKPVFAPGNPPIYSFSSTSVTTQCQGTNSIGPGCFFRQLRTDGDLKAMTVEGWVKPETVQGGYVMSIGQDKDRIGGGALHPDCALPALSRDFINKCKISTMDIRVNSTHVTVGHDTDMAVTPFAMRTEVSFGVCSDTQLCADLGGSLTNKWVHIAIQRFTKQAGNVNGFRWLVTYRVFLNGKILELAKYPGGDRPTVVTHLTNAIYQPGETYPVAGPRMSRNLNTCPTETCRESTPWDCGCMDNFAVGTALIFGAYKGALGGEQYFDGYLDEWRFWNGAMSQTGIVDNMKRKLRPETSHSYGDPADPTFVVTATNFMDVAVLMALYNFDLSLAKMNTCGLAGMYGCDLNELLPSFPAPGDNRVPTVPGVVMYKAYGRNAKTAPTDDTGLVFYSSGGNLQVQSGNLTLDVATPGLYQVTLLLAMPGGVAKVPVDFIVNVQDSAWVAGKQAYQLCNSMTPPASIPCRYQGNLYAPLLKMMASVLPSGSCSAKSFPAGGAPTDISEFLYPCSVTIYTGFNFVVQLVGQDVQPNTMPGFTERSLDWRDTNVGFTIGPSPKTATFTAVKDTNPAIMEMHWTPCQEDVGFVTICFEAVDRHVNRTTGVSIPSATSEMKCLQLEVRPDPSPRFDVGEGMTSTETVQFTIGKEGSFMLYAMDDNCLDNITMHAALGEDGHSTLPEGAMLRHVATPAGACMSIARQFVWTPAIKHGGFNQHVCFVVEDTPGACSGMQADNAVHCVPVQVRRCIYAMQYDEQLQDIAGRVGTDWMRLWSLNSALSHPDYVVYMGQEIMVGHLFRTASKREMPSEIAKRMGMDEQQLKDLNFDLDLTQPLDLGQMLCVVPNPCTGLKELPIRLPSA